MEVIEEMFEKVIKDSSDEKNKIKNMSDEHIASSLLEYSKKTIDSIGIGSVDECTISELITFVRLVKRYKPGYVLKDLMNLFDLGSLGYEFNFSDKPEAMEPIINFSSQELFDKWFRVYGMRRHRHKDFDANKLYVTNRNECIASTFEVNKKRYSDFGQIGHSSLSGLKKANGAEYMKKNFPNLIALLRGDTEVGIEIEDIPVTNETDPLYDL